jgi:hypothetical protein
MCYGVHNLADIRQASSAFGIFCGTVAAAQLLFPGDLFHNRRAAVFGNISYDILLGEFKAITD